MICLIVVILAVSGITVYFFNPPNGNEIMFIGHQFVPPVAENEKGTYIFILINRKGQYFILNREEMLEKGKSIMEVKDYYSHNYYKTDGKILNPYDMFLCYRWLKKIDSSSEREYEYFLSDHYSEYPTMDCFSIIGCINDKSDITFYNVIKQNSFEVQSLNDPYVKKIVNKLLKNWPIKNGELYIERETWLE